MNINFGPRGIVEINDARIVFRNFAGGASKFNHEGDRNFAVVIPNEEIADALHDERWNVRTRSPRDEDDAPFMFLPVKIKFNGRGPAIYLQSGRSRVTLDEDSVECLDNIDISSVSLDVRPYDWEMHGKTGRTAYLQSMLVIQNVDRFAANEEYPCE